jgi:hypothetical protein
MTMVDLIAEMDRAGSAHAALEGLLAVGVPRQSITLPPPSGIAGSLGLTSVRVTVDGTFEFTNSGPPTVVIGVHGPDLDLVDLVAWRPSNPARWRLRLGFADFLGEVHADYAALLYGPLRLFNSPLSWLRAGCDGAVLLDAKFGLSTLRDASAVFGDDREHIQAIDRLLRQPILPMPRLGFVTEAHST